MSMVVSVLSFIPAMQPTMEVVTTMANGGGAENNGGGADNNGGQMVITRQPAADQVGSAICLRACYAMSGTDLVYPAICLRACYAISGTTDLGYVRN
eukprot:2867045-Rhodomonas_salina.10